MARLFARVLAFPAEARTPGLHPSRRHRGRTATMPTTESSRIRTGPWSRSAATFGRAGGQLLSWPGTCREYRASAPSGSQDVSVVFRPMSWAPSCAPGGQRCSGASIAVVVRARPHVQEVSR